MVPYENYLMHSSSGFRVGLPRYTCSCMEAGSAAAAKLALLPRLRNWTSRPSSNHGSVIDPLPSPPLSG